MSNPEIFEYTLLKSLTSSAPSSGTQLMPAPNSAATRLRQLIHPPPDNPSSPGTSDSSRPKLTKKILQPLLNLLEGQLIPVLGEFLSGPLATALSLPDEDQVASEIGRICDLLRYGARAFFAGGGSIESLKQDTTQDSATDDTPPRPSKRRRSGTSSSSGRARRYHDMVVRRDRVCVVLNVGGVSENDVAHIIPISLRDRKPNSVAGESAQPNYHLFMTTSFWQFLELFLGVDKTTAIRHRFSELDRLENLLYLAKNVHGLFGRGQVALLPVLTPEQELLYDPKVTSEYDVLVEFPTHIHKDPPVLARFLLEGGLRRPHTIDPGYRITLKTDNPSIYPLPNPALLLLHSIISRIIGASGAADVYDDFIDYPEFEEGLVEDARTDSSCEEDPGTPSRIQDWISVSVSSSEYPVDTKPLGCQIEHARPIHIVMAEKDDRALERGLIRYSRKRKQS